MPKVNSTRYLRLLMLLHNAGLFFLRAILLKCIKSLNYDSVDTLLKPFKYSLKLVPEAQNRFDELFPDGRDSDIEQWDITLLSAVLIHCCTLETKIDMKQLKKHFNKTHISIDSLLNDKTNVDNIKALKDRLLVSDYQYKIIFRPNYAPSTNPLDDWGIDLLLKVMVATCQTGKDDDIREVMKSGIKNQLYRELTENETPRLDKFLKKYKSKLSKNKNGIITDDRLKEIFPDNKNPDFNKWETEVLLGVVLCLFESLSQSTINGIKKIRNLRNVLSHPSSTSINQEEFDLRWDEVYKTFEELVLEEIPSDFETFSRVAKDCGKEEVNLKQGYVSKILEESRAEQIKAAKDLQKKIEQTNSDEYSKTNANETKEVKLEIRVIAPNEQLEQIAETRIKELFDNKDEAVSFIINKIEHVRTETGCVVLVVRYSSPKQLLQIIEFVYGDELQNALYNIAHKVKSELDIMISVIACIPWHELQRIGHGIELLLQEKQPQTTHSKATTARTISNSIDALTSSEMEEGFKQLSMKLSKELGQDIKVYPLLESSLFRDEFPTGQLYSCVDQDHDVEDDTDISYKTSDICIQETVVDNATYKVLPSGITHFQTEGNRFSVMNLKASKLFVDGGGYFAKQLLLQKAIQGTINTLDEFLAEKPVRQTIKKLKRKLLIKGSQFDIIYPSNGNPTNLDEWDITLVTLILNNCLTLSPAEYIAVQDIRDLRNSLYGHTAEVEMTNAEFQQKWTNISSILTNHVTLLTNPNSIAVIQAMITRISKETLSADATIHTLKEWYEWRLEVEHKLEELIEDQRTLFYEAETKSEDRHRDTTDQLGNIQATQERTAEDVSKILKKIKSEKRSTFQGTKLKRKQNQRVDTRKYLGHISDNVSLLLKHTKEAKVETVDKRELNRKIKQAKLKLEAHKQNLEKFNIPCKTRMTETVTQQLQKNKIVVLKGIPGSGKSHLSKNVLNHFLSLNPDIYPLIISKASEIEKVLDPDGSFVLLVDDMIGKISFDATEYKNWVQYIETFMSHVKVGQLYVVLTIRTAIFRQCHIEEMSDIFATENVKETDGYLLENEKREILELYRQYHDIDISSDKLDTIVQQQYVGIGFPLLCRMMIGHDVEEMFSRPTEYIKAEISPHASGDPLVFVTLFMTLIGDSILSTNELELTQDQKACFKALQNYFKTSKIDMYKVYQTAQMIEKTFLSFDEKENNFSFIHEAVAHSTFEVAFEIQPGVLIERCPFDSLIRNMNLIIESSNIELKPTNPYMLYRQHIINRMIHVMSADDISNIKIVTRASIWKNKAFVDENICKFDTRQLYLEDEKGMTLLFHFAGFGRKYALKGVIERLEKDNQIQLANHLQLALENACVSAEKECVDYLLTKVDAINSQVVIAAVKGGNLEIVKEIAGNFGMDKIETVKEKNTDRTLLHIAAEKGSYDLVTYLHQMCPSLRDKIDRNGCNAIHLSATCVTKGAIDCLNFFIDMGISPSIQNSNGESILSQAVQYGNIENVKYICEKYPELLHLTDNDGFNDLHDAAYRGTVECVKFLIDKGIDPEDRTSNGKTILHLSAFSGNIATLKYICDTYPDLLLVTMHDGFNGLHQAAQNGTVDSVKFLIHKGIDTGNMISDGRTIIHFSANGGNIATLKYICDTYPDMLPVTDNGGCNALHDAAHKGTIECVKFLIDKGIDPGVRTSDGSTLLHMSALGGNIATLKYICDTYPDLLPKKDNNGFNALHNAAQGGTVNCVKFLIDKGIDPRDRTNDGSTLLHMSAAGGKIATLEYICDTYPDMLPVTSNDGCNALHESAHSGTVECVKFLIDNGIDPGDRSSDEQTILHSAAAGGNVNTLKYICETYPYLLHTTDIRGNNALHFALIGDNSIACLDLLLDQNVDPLATNDEGRNILHMALISFNVELIQIIITKCNHFLNTEDITIIQDLLNTAIETGNTEMTELCLNIISEKTENTVTDG